MSLATEPVAKNAHLWIRHPEDWYVEPNWTSARLFAAETFNGGIIDPSCGTGRILDSAKVAGYRTQGYDIVHRGDVASRHPFLILDFFLTNFIEIEGANVVSNPPFGVADRYARHAIKHCGKKVALLLPTKWMNSAKRGAWLQTTPLRRVWLLAPRPSMPPGPVIEAGIRPGNGTVDFAWFVWEFGYVGLPELHWLRRDA